jgi:ABC-type hemin transport system substrate-binding protein
VALSPSALKRPVNTRAAWQDVLDRVRHVAGVQSVATTDIVPMGGDENEIGYWTTAAAPPANQITTDVGDARLLEGDGHLSAPRPIL